MGARGRLPAIAVHVLPKSVVRYRYGAKSSFRNPLFDDERGRRVVRRREHAADPALRIRAGGRQRRRQVRPRAAVILRQLHLAVVGAHPDRAGPQRRLRDRRDRAVGHVQADLRRVVRREVGADFLPRVAAVERAEQDLRAGVDDLRVVRRERDRRDPVVAKPRLALRPRRRDVRAHAGPLIQPAHLIQLARVVDPAAVGGIDDVVHPVAGPDGDPVLERDAAGRAVARALPRVVVLEAAVDVVRDRPCPRRWRRPRRCPCSGSSRRCGRRRATRSRRRRCRG